MKNLLLTLITAIALTSCASCNKDKKCPEMVDVVVRPNTSITKMVATHSEGMGFARFTDSTLEFNAVVGTVFKIQSVHEKDTIMIVDVNGRKYEVQPMSTADIPVYCN